MKIIKTEITAKNVLSFYLENQRKSEVIDPKTLMK
ncbi:Uncharacterised protein [Chryseobacterium carnipullorum]|uniref:Uncharacterized protein n=1 Tax=Chryseobacterium carnipullorum TaxID=1124835 RepID=A0A376DR32_CHRCU|nr:Uncharacterised protein [Chryseobacterium carnipullorum]